MCLQVFSPRDFRHRKMAAQGMSIKKIAETLWVASENDGAVAAEAGTPHRAA